MIRPAAALGALAVLGPATLGGQGLPFHTETALTTAFAQRGARVFAKVVTRESVTTVVTPLVLLPLAPHERVTTAVILPVVARRMSAPGASGETVFSAAGFADVSVSAKWAVLVRDRPGGTTRVALVAALRLPTGATGARFRDGTPAPPPLQLGHGAVQAGATLVGTLVRGRWGVSVDVGHARSAAANAYRFGPETRYNVALGRRFPGYIATIRTQTLQLYLEWNGSITGRHREGGTDVVNSGGHVGFLSPGVQWVPIPQLLFEGSLQIPIVVDLNGTQPDVRPRPAFGTRVLF